MCRLTNKQKAHGKNTKCIRYDNAEENLTLQKEASRGKRKYNIVFEFTVRATLRQNILVETRFVSILNKERALLINSNVLCLTRHNMI